MKTLIFLSLLSCSLLGSAQRAATIVNFSVRAADTAQTCYNIYETPRWREQILPVHSCAGVAAWNAGTAFGAWQLDRWLRAKGHPRLAQFQWFSAAGSGYGIAYSLKWRL